MDQAIIEKAREFQKNTYSCFIDYSKGFDYVDLNKLWKILKEMATWPGSWEICKQVKKQQLQLDREQRADSKLRKEYVKVIHCHTAYLTYMQSISCKMPDWMKHKL